MKQVDADAEMQALLTSLQAEDSIRYEMISSLQSIDFGVAPFRKAYSIICELAATSHSLPNTDVFLRLPNLPEEVVNFLGRPHISPLRSIEDVKHLVKILVYYRNVRTCHSFIAEITNKFVGDSPPDMDSVKSDMEKTLFKLQEGEDRAPIYHMGKGHNSDDIFNRLMLKDAGDIIPSTFNNFDKIAGGWGRTNFVSFAAPAKGGKSILTQNVCIRQYMMLCQDVLMIPLEMDEIESIERVMSCLTGINNEKFRLGKLTEYEVQVANAAWKAFKEHGEKNGCRFTIWPSTSLNINEFISITKPMRYNVAAIDYINLMDVPGSERMPEYQKISILGKELKKAAKMLKCLVIAPTQLNDDETLRYSKALREHCNNVWTWVMDEEARLTKTIRVNQMVSRSWAPFSFLLEIDMDTSIIKDSKLSISDFDNRDVGDKDNSHKFKKRKGSSRMNNL